MDIRWYLLEISKNFKEFQVKIFFELFEVTEEFEIASWEWKRGNWYFKEFVEYCTVTSMVDLS